ncbi:MAG: LPS translocon maturation chaperone LptM [Bauldia sp.]
MMQTRRSPLVALVALALVAAALSGCGRKGPLEPPPSAAATTTIDPAPAATAPVP